VQGCHKRAFTKPARPGLGPGDRGKAQLSAVQYWTFQCRCCGWRWGSLGSPWWDRRLGGGITLKIHSSFLCVKINPHTYISARAVQWQISAVQCSAVQGNICGWRWGLPRSTMVVHETGGHHFETNILLLFACQNKPINISARSVQSSTVQCGAV
jgi:hypothetical protein